MLFTLSASSCKPQGVTISLPFAASFAIFLAHLVVSCSSLRVLPFSSKPIVTLIGPVAQTPGDLLLAGVCFLVMPLSLGNARSKTTSPNHPLRQSIAPCLLRVPRSFGWCGLLTELGFSPLHPTPLHADNTSAIQNCSQPRLSRMHQAHRG
ncbi:unnamed protein product [Prunus armeniaca]